MVGHKPVPLGKVYPGLQQMLDEKDARIKELEREVVHERERAESLDKQLVAEVAINNEQTFERKLKNEVRLDKFQSKMDVFMSGGDEASDKTCADCRDKDIDPESKKHRCYWCGLGRRFQFWLWRPRRE
jgi:hypothetical protein